MKSRWQTTYVFVISAIALLKFEAAAACADYSWASAASGNWAQAGNWFPSTGFPSSPADTATINTSAALTVTENSDISIQRLSIPLAAPTLNVGGKLTLANAFVSPGIVNLAGATTSTGVAGQLKVTGGSLTNQGTLNVGAHGALAAGAGGIINLGVINLLSPVNLDRFAYFDHITGDVTNRGTFEVFGNTLNVEFGPSGNMFSNHGTLLVDSGATLAPFQGTLTNETDGTLRGGGVIGNSSGTLNNHGLLSPGDSLGPLSINTNVFQQFSDGRLRIEIGGTNPGVTYDVLALNSGILGGTLDVQFMDGFVPAPSDAFTIITGNSLQGQFANTPGGVLTTAMGRFAVNYGATAVVLTGIPVPEPSGGVLMAIAIIAGATFHFFHGSNQNRSQE